MNHGNINQDNINQDNINQDNITDTPQESPTKFESKPKAHIALEGSDSEDSGIVKDTLCDINWVPGQGHTIGIWSRSKIDGLIHISLLTSIEALYDSAIRTWEEFAKERTQQKERKARGVRGPSKKTLAESEEQLQAKKLSDEEKLKYNDMRAKLMRSRQ